MRLRAKSMVIPADGRGDASARPRRTVPLRLAVPRLDAGDEVLVPLPRTNRFPLSAASIEEIDATPGKHRPRRPWPLPRRQREAEVFRASRARIAVRLLAWSYALAHYGARNLWDRLRGVDTPAQRGVRLRETFQHMGGTFLKLGQQLSTRLDLLPFDTCRELSHLLDDMKPFPTARAAEAIQRVTGKPLDETFARFDPTPLGSMSVACVYHAVLVSGEEVVVKVRRPGIGTRFAADFAALELLCRGAESLTLIRPGFTRALHTELRTMLMEELDFRSEARYQELFRAQAKRDGQHVSAPRVYYEHSGKDVLVGEYVRGIWLQDLIATKERGDEATLAYLATLGIAPKKVAKRLLRTFYWSTFETLFYHADPHPGNIVVKPGSELVFANFSACGPTTHKNRRNYGELFRRLAKRDLDGMVQVFGNILSPLPPTDVHALMKAAEAKVARWQYGFDSKHAEWWERSSAGLWIGVLEMARDRGIPVNIETNRFFRASLLCDTMAARLYERIKGPREFEKYQRQAERRVARRALRRWNRDFTAGQALVRVERVAELAGRLTYKLQDLSDQPTTSFLAALNKGSFVVSSFLRLGFAAGLATSVAMCAVALAGYLDGAPPTALAVLGRVAASPWYWGAMILLAVRSYRIVQYRLGDVDRQG